MEIKNTSKALKISTEPKKVSHASKMKAKFASNRVAILMELELTETEYENQFLEIGCQFLDVVFGEGSEWYNKLSLDPKYMFWKWFKIEFKIIENDFVHVLQGGEVELSLIHYNEVLDQLPHDQYLEKSLYQFLRR